MESGTRGLEFFTRSLSRFHCLLRSQFKGKYFAKKTLKNNQGVINSIQAKFPEIPKLSCFTP